ncbi:cdkn1a interacting zinc finger protein 1b isoform X2 [Corythoichthys intestinalis]|uniref:cdkn1a interacting zinc finger protein 1b isoform X2 n=1 Tax=Corythoichthys intestinalis TaxID=161448 RepID=UPI0025A4D204|nr:cdkn1a interacting zinc finger protein 1b isoform X2 [Corythoichthys intestinalis]
MMGVQSQFRTMRQRRKKAHIAEEAAAMRINAEEGTGSSDQPNRGGSAQRDGVFPPEQQDSGQNHDTTKTSECVKLSTSCVCACALQGPGSLKVTIQQRGDCREFPQRDKLDAEQLPAVAGLHCHVCRVTCHSMQVFEEHMSNPDHVTKWKELTHSVNVITHTLTNRKWRWCNVCQTHFSNDVINHRRTQQHKASKRASQPFCEACRRHLRTPRKFVEHMKSDKHKQQVRLREAQEEELITVDAIGCFEKEGESKQKVELGHEEKEAATSQQGWTGTKKQPWTLTQPSPQESLYTDPLG